MESVPDDIGRLGECIEVIPADDECPRHLLLINGSGFGHWGLRVGPPGFDPAPAGFACEKLADGVWLLWD